MRNYEYTDITILVDIDGVCANFVKAVFEALGYDVDDALIRWKSGIDKNIGKKPDELYHYFNIEKKDFWDAITSAGESFWANMETYSWYGELIQFIQYVCHKVEVDLSDDKDRFNCNWFYCTSPSLNPESLSGKVKWMQKHHHKYFRNFVITPHKHLLANKYTMLIDDLDRKITKFKQHGGRGILFPQFWNTTRNVYIDSHESKLIVLRWEIQYHINMIYTEQTGKHIPNNFWDTSKEK